MGILKPQKTALVTGSSRGIGAAIAARLAQDGFLVVVNYAKGAGAAQEVVQRIEAAGGRAVSVRADLTENEELVHLFERTTDLGAPLGGGVHNAGIQLLGSHAEMSGENVDRLTAANLKAAFSVLSQATRRVVEGGRIIALSSGTSVVLPPR
jgi:3-oxoacyl-[acyl-carrier protein] reductase